jgi:hypothetical protein
VTQFTTSAASPAPPPRVIPRASLRILITGSRFWTDEDAIRQAITIAARGVSSHKITVVHGGARGADTIAGRVAESFDIDVEVHQANWRRYGKSAGHRRNADMVNLGADICLAFPIGESRGTRGCMKLAEQAGIPVRVLEGAVVDR